VGSSLASYFVLFSLISLVSFYFVFISLISFRFVSFLLISFRFVSYVKSVERRGIKITEVQ
jgi:ABC-type multidrug transport system permease subunit